MTKFLNNVVIIVCEKIMRELPAAMFGVVVGLKTIELHLLLITLAGFSPPWLKFSVTPKFLFYFFTFPFVSSLCFVTFFSNHIPRLFGDTIFMTSLVDVSVSRLSQTTAIFARLGGRDLLQLTFSFSSFIILFFSSGRK